MKTPSGIHIRISIEEFEAILRKSGHLQSWGYIKDYHFEEFALDSIKNRQDALNFADQLDSESKHKKCNKARSIRHWLEESWSIFNTEQNDFSLCASFILEFSAFCALYALASGNIKAFMSFLIFFIFFCFKSGGIFFNNCYFAV